MTEICPSELAELGDFTLEQIGQNLRSRYSYNPKGYGQAVCPCCGNGFIKNHPKRVFCDLGCKKTDRVKRTQQWRIKETKQQAMDLRWEDHFMTIKPWMLVRGLK